MTSLNQDSPVSENDHTKHLRRAVELARACITAGDGGPFGAVVVKDDQVIAEGWNRVIRTNDPTAHAEVTAIRAACEALGTFHLTGAVIYCSCEPCPMCLGALYWARPEAVYFAATRHDAAAVGFSDALIYDEIGMLPDGRSLPFRRLEVAGASDVFAQWLAMPGRVDY